MGNSKTPAHWEHTPCHLAVGRVRRTGIYAAVVGSNAGTLEFSWAGLLLDQNLHGAANEGLRHLRRHCLLRRHGQGPPLFLDFVRDLAGHFPCPRSLLLRVSENAQSLELRLANETQQLPKSGLGLAWETDDERRAQGDARNPRPNSPKEIQDVLLRSFAPHPLQHVWVDVLQGDVHVAGDLRTLGDGSNQLVRPMRRMRVEQANP